MHWEWVGLVGLGVGIKTGGVTMRMWLDGWVCSCLEEIGVNWSGRGQCLVVIQKEVPAMIGHADQSIHG